MPKIGEVVRGIDIGEKDYHKRIWVACPDCGKERWVLIRGGKPQSERCHPCGAKIAGQKKKEYRGERHWHWRGGRHINKNGYVTVAVAADSPFAAMRDKDGQVYEHRLIAAQHMMGRCLYAWEEVHHLNHNKQDNRPENLEILSKADHAFKNSDVKTLVERIHELEHEVQLLRRELGKTQA